jgi:thioredoxin-like negative regulator of GroEL
MGEVPASARREGALDRQDDRPRLVFFYSPTSGACRRAEAYIAQVLQRRHNHDTFDLTRISVDQRPDLAERFHVDKVPTIVIVQGRKVRHRIVGPFGPRLLASSLKPWLH